MDSIQIDFDVYEPGALELTKYEGEDLIDLFIRGCDLHNCRRKCII